MWLIFYLWFIISKKVHYSNVTVILTLKFKTINLNYNIWENVFGKDQSSFLFFYGFTLRDIRLLSFDYFSFFLIDYRFCLELFSTLLDWWIFLVFEILDFDFEVLSCFLLTLFFWLGLDLVKIDDFYFPCWLPLWAYIDVLIF